MAAVSVRLIRTGSIAMPRGYTYRGESLRSTMVVPLGAALIEHPTAGPVLVDTGIQRGNLGPVMGIVFRGLRIGPEETVPARLREWGVELESVKTVVMTHLHVDHTSAMSELPNATFVITPAEWKAAHARLGVLNGYVRAHLPPEPAVRFADFDADGVAWEGFDRTIDLLGDGTIRLVFTPGHTVGHLSVLVEKTFLLGDAVYTLRNLREDLLPMRTADNDASRDSMRRLRAFADAHPEVALVPTHDPDVWR